MKRVLDVLFWPVAATVAGGMLYVVGSRLWHGAFSTDDAQAIVGNFFTYAAASFWTVGALALVIRLLRELFGKRSARSADSDRPSRRLPGRLALGIGIVVGTALVIAIGAGGQVALRRFLDQQTLAAADPAMVSLADQAGMSQKGKIVFLRTHPEMVSDAQMQSVCASNTAANNSNGFIEQGCFVPTENRIYIRKMPNNLHKLEISTAAYEMLHPVYLSIHESSHGSTLDAAIEANFTALNDAKLNAQVENFSKTEPGARDLELFSLLGTGYSNLSDALAAYYAPYFDNVGATVTANNEVLQLFKTDQEKLTQLQKQIKQNDDLANNAYAESVRWAHAGDQAKDDYYYSSYKQYIGQENAAVDEYNKLLQVYNALVTEYNGTQPVQKIQQAPAASE